MSRNRVLYKYRTLDNIAFLRDILENNRLYAAKFDEMNDPMEGLYSSYPHIQDRIKQGKESFRICSLCKSPDNFLMWSHYADAHKGIAIGVKVKDQNISNVKNIKYVRVPKELDIINPYDIKDDIITDILLEKLYYWKYEEEVRVLKKSSNSIDHVFVEVDIKEIILGYKMSDEHKILVKDLISEIKPDFTNIKELSFEDALKQTQRVIR